MPIIAPDQPPVDFTSAAISIGPGTPAALPPKFANRKPGPWRRAPDPRATAMAVRLSDITKLIGASRKSISDRRTPPVILHTPVASPNPRA